MKNIFKILAAVAVLGVLWALQRFLKSKTIQQNSGVVPAGPVAPVVALPASSQTTGVPSAPAELIKIAPTVGGVDISAPIVPADQVLIKGLAARRGAILASMM